MTTTLQASIATLAGLALLASPAAAQAPPEASYPATNFAATHNSYSGNIAGQRGAIAEQLASGVRFVEYDINLGAYSSNGDYQIGHGSPGRQVDHTAPNPASNDLAAWLGVLAAWSDQNPGHAPIALGLDAKDDLSRPGSPSQGNLSALNAELQKYLGSRLYTAAELGPAAWPATGELAGRILVVLSGNQTTRQRYRSDQGRTPAVAINAAGQAIVVYQSTQSSNLWYWYGNAAADGGIAWPVHGSYDTGSAPAVAIGDGGAIVEVHRSESTSELWSRVGVFANGEVGWGPSQKLGASGSLPSVSFTGAAAVSEIHVGKQGQNQLFNGTVDAAARTIRWTSAGSTSQPRFPTTTATAGSRSVTVTTGTDGAGTQDTLLYSTPQVSRARVAYPQVMFTELQKGDSSRLGNDGLWFYASSSSSGNWTWAGQQRQAGKIVRLWAFGQSDAQVPIAPNFAATDTPYAGWYAEYCAIRSCRQ